MDRNHLQPNPNYNAAFTPNPAPNVGQQQEPQPQGEPVPPLANASDLSAPVSPRGLQNYRTRCPLEEAPDTFNLPEYQPIKPGEPHMQKLADEAENTKKLERLLKHAREDEEAGDFKDAEKAYKQALKFTENAEHYKRYVACLKNLSVSSKDEAKKKTYREKAARAFYYLGELYTKQGAWKPAQAAYKTSCELACHTVPLQALVAVSRQLGEKGDIVDALGKLADFYAGKGKIDLAIERLKEAFELGESFAILDKLEALYSREGNSSQMHELAIQRFELQLNQDPKNIGLYRDYAWFLKDIGKRNEARAVKKRMDGLSQTMQHKIVKQKTKIRDLKQTMQSQDGKVESLEKQIEFLGKQVTHLDCSHWPDMRDADLIPLLKKNPSLQCLSLDGCIYLTDVVLDILPAYFENLQELNLRGCKGITAAGLDAIAENATKLKRLTLDHCPATTITLLHKLNTKGIIFRIEGVVFEKKVLNLRPHKDDLTDAELLKALEAKPEITEVNVEYCSKITDAGLAPLKNFQWLTGLQLYTCQVTNEGLQHLLSGLPRLTHLYFGSNSKVTNEALKLLIKFPQLISLGLSACFNITEAGLKHLAGLNQLTHLYLNGCTSLTDAGLCHLLGLPRLVYLNIGGCTKLTSEGLQHLAGLTQLKQLTMYGHTQFTDADLYPLKGLTQLTRLYLGGCTNLTSECLQHLRGFTHLRELNLEGCTKISSNAKEELKNQIPGLEIKE